MLVVRCTESNNCRSEFEIRQLSTGHWCGTYPVIIDTDAEYVGTLEKGIYEVKCMLDTKFGCSSIQDPHLITESIDNKSLNEIRNNWQLQSEKQLRQAQFTRYTMIVAIVLLTFVLAILPVALYLAYSKKHAPSIMAVTGLIVIQLFIKIGIAAYTAWSWPIVIKISKLSAQIFYYIIIGELIYIVFLLFNKMQVKLRK